MERNGVNTAMNLQASGHPSKIKPFFFFKTVSTDKKHQELTTNETHCLLLFSASLCIQQQSTVPSSI
jgi:hypothetical protein